MRRRFGEFLLRLERGARRALWWLIPLLASLVLFDVWVSWALQQPTMPSNIAAAGIICAWVWLASFERRS